MIRLLARFLAAVLPPKSLLFSLGADLIGVIQTRVFPEKK